MTRILIQRGSAGTSSSSNRSPQVSSAAQSASTSRVEEQEKDVHHETGTVDDPMQQAGSSESRAQKNAENFPENSQEARTEAGITDAYVEKEKPCNDEIEDLRTTIRELDGLELSEDVECSCTGSSQIVTGSSYPPPPPPVPPPKPPGTLFNPRRTPSGNSNAVRIGSSRRPQAWPVVSTRTSPSDSRPSSPKSFGEADGYNSADEQNTCFGSSYGDAEKDHFFEVEIKRTKGLEVRRMIEDGNCLFRAIADQVYGDPEVYDMTRQMCIDYMERERDHFSQFITEGFTSYCKRKRRDKVYGNNVEIQAFSEMYNHPIHIYSYSTEPINIFHGGYNTDNPPIRLSYHHGNHYNSLVDPRKLTVGVGLGLSSLQGVSGVKFALSLIAGLYCGLLVSVIGLITRKIPGTDDARDVKSNVNKDQVKAAIKAQQDQQIDNALLAEGRFYSDLELTEKEIERMVMEASRAEYLAEDKFKQQLGFSESSTSRAEPSSSGAAGSRQSHSGLEGGSERIISGTALSESMQMVLAMGFSYLQVVEAYSIFGNDVDSMVCYLLEMGSGSGSPGNMRQKGKQLSESSGHRD